MKKFLPIFIICGILLTAGAFGGGYAYAQHKTTFPERGQGFQQFNGQGPTMNGKQTSTNLTDGEIIAKDDQSLTVKLRAGGSKIVIYSSGTPITKSTDGTIDDLAIGKTVMVTGTTNTDGSLTAKSIQLRPTNTTPAAENQ